MDGPVLAAAESGARFTAKDELWCGVQIDPRGRRLELTPSFLRAWNIVADQGGRYLRYPVVEAHTEDEARTLICGGPRCELGQMQIVQATAGGKAGVGVLIPAQDQLVVVGLGPVPAGCKLEPEIEVDWVGELVHITVDIPRGEYARYYFHGELDDAYGPGYPPSAGACDVQSTLRTDVIVAPDRGELELTLTQDVPRGQVRPAVEVRLTEARAELVGCNDILELAWTP